MSDIVFVGPPGAGKGTIAQILARADLVQHISTGDLIRDHLKALDANDPLHVRMADGHLMSDDEITYLLVRKLEQGVYPRIVLDGYPRTIEQVEILDKILDKLGRTLSAVVSFKLPDDEIIKRISGRYSCRSCAHVYHESFNPAPNDTCHCGETQFLKRNDDHVEVISSRLKRFHTRTEPLIDLYRQRGILREVDADQPIDRVSNMVLDLIN